MGLMNCRVEGSGVRDFCVSVEAGSASKLKLLREIDDVVDWLSGHEKELKGTREIAEKYLDAVRACEPIHPLDPDGSIVEQSQRAERVLMDFVQMLKKKQEAAYRDPELRGDHEDAIVGSYQGAIDAAQRLHDVMTELRWAIMEHDADTEKDSDKRYGSVDEMLKVIK